jgi:hypothetical protein
MRNRVIAKSSQVSRGNATVQVDKLWRKNKGICLTYGRIIKLSKFFTGFT